MSTSIIIALITSATAIAAAATYAAKKLAAFAKTEAGAKWSPYIGFGLWAVKLAEVTIPDNTENKALAKMDYASKKFIERWESETGEKVTSPIDVAQIKALIEEALEIAKSNGTLNK